VGVFVDLLRSMLRNKRGCWRAREKQGRVRAVRFLKGKERLRNKAENCGLQHTRKTHKNLSIYRKVFVFILAAIRARAKLLSAEAGRFFRLR
jgi:hypothetical protein